MDRNPANPNRRAAASSLAGLAMVIGVTLIATAPARADHARDAFHDHFARVAVSHFALASDLFFGRPPVVEVYPVVYPPVVEVHRVVYHERPAIHVHKHHRRGHPHYKHGRGPGWAHARHDFRRHVPPHERWHDGPRHRRHR